MTNATSKLIGLPYFNDLNGDVLDSGNVWIGTPNTDPRQNPVTVYYDEAQTIPAVQPLRVMNGHVTRAGSVAEIFLSPPYAIYVENKNHELVYSLPSVDDPLVTAISGLVTVPVNTIAALRLIDHTKNTTANVLGYYAPRDGGGGLYVYDPTDTLSSDNGGSIIVAADGARWKLDNIYIMTPKQFGAKMDGVTDDTANWNALVTALPTSGMIDGQNLLSIVSTINLKSNMIIVNHNLKTVAGSTAFRSPLTVDATAANISNIYIGPGKIDGNRANQTNIVTPGPEDGGLHGIRLVGNGHQITDVHIHKNQLVNCGTAGLAMISNVGGTAGTNQYVFQRIYVDGCTFLNNREHGWFCDSVTDVHVTNFTSRFNGLDLNTTDPLTNGTRGARDANGHLYGAAFDVEGYYVASGIDGLWITGGDCRSNALFATLTDPTLSTTSGYVVRQNIHIMDCDFDQGSYGATITAPSFMITGSQSPVDAGACYAQVHMANNRFQGTPQFHNCDLINVVGGNVANSSAFKAEFYKSTRYTWAVPGTVSAIFEDALPVVNPPTLTPVSGPTLTFSAAWTLLRTEATGELVFKWAGTIGASASGTSIYTYALPAGYSAKQAFPQACNNATGAPVGLVFDTTNARFILAAAGAVTHYFEMTLVLALN